MTGIKICGLTRKEDIDYVNKSLPDYVGFVFTESKRRISKEDAKILIDLLDSNIKKVGVFLNNDIEEVIDISNYCNLDIIQLHGDESPDYCNKLDKDVWKAFRIKYSASIENIKRYDVAGYLLDTYIKGEYGGTGKVFNWDIVKDLSKDRFIILAGGLNNDNVRVAIDIVNPQVVDLSSGVETDGYKDYIKIRDIIRNVRDRYE